MARVRTSVRVVELDTETNRRLRQLVKSANGSVVKVGYAEGAASEEGFPMAAIAAVHEFGAPSKGIPERSFLRSAITENVEFLIKVNKDSLKRVVEGSLTVDQALGRLGEFAKAKVQEKITQGPFAPLKPSTIAAKGSSAPLIDTGQMRSSVSWELGKEGDDA